MARARKLPKEFKNDPILASLPLDCVCFYENLQNVLEPSGVIHAKIGLLRHSVFPCRDDVTSQKVTKWVNLLILNRKLVKIVWQNQELLYCPDFHKYQALYSDEVGTIEVPYAFVRDAATKAGVYMPENLQKRDGKGTRALLPSSSSSSSTLPLPSTSATPTKNRLPSIEDLDPTDPDYPEKKLAIIRARESARKRAKAEENPEASLADLYAEIERRKQIQPIMNSEENPTTSNSRLKHFIFHNLDQATDFIKKNNDLGPWDVSRRENDTWKILSHASDNR